MRALLNSLGLTLWSSIAIILALGLAMVGYRSSLTIRDSPLAMSSAGAGVQAAPAVPRGSAARSPPSESTRSHGELISPIIGPEMIGAQAALQAGRWQDALDDVQAAERHQGITVFDRFKVHDFRAYAEFKLSKYEEAEADYEAALAAGRYTPEEAARTTKILFRVAARNQQYAKAIEYGNQLVSAGKAKPDDLTFVAQLYYLSRQCDDSVAWADEALTAFKQAGEAPSVTAYQLKLQCATDTGNTAAMSASLVDLVRLTDDPTYWNILLRLERQGERNDDDLLMIYRIMSGTGSMEADTDYIEMAQLLGDSALAGEAAAVLQKALSLRIVRDEHRERVTRLLDALQGHADADQSGLLRQAAESRESSIGELDVKLGQIYYGFEDYQSSAEAITRGLRKGLVTHKADAYVYLGLAQLKLKNFAAAQRAFASLKNVPDVSPNLLRLWGLYADTLAGQTQAAEQGAPRQLQLGNRY